MPITTQVDFPSSSKKIRVGNLEVECLPERKVGEVTKTYGETFKVTYDLIARPVVILPLHP